MVTYQQTLLGSILLQNDDAGGSLHVKLQHGQGRLATLSTVTVDPAQLVQRRPRPLALILGLVLAASVQLVL